MESAHKKEFHGSLGQNERRLTQIITIALSRVRLVTCSSM